MDTHIQVARLKSYSGRITRKCSENYAEIKQTYKPTFMYIVDFSEKMSVRICTKMKCYDGFLRGGDADGLMVSHTHLCTPQGSYKDCIE